MKSFWNVCGSSKKPAYEQNTSGLSESSSAIPRKIKVARIIARLNIGGPAKQAILLTKRLNGSLFQSYLITGRVSEGEASLDFNLNDLKSQIRFLPSLRREISWIQDVCAFVAILKTLKTIQPDIVHTHTAKAGTIGRLAAIVARVPVRIHTFHGHIFKGYFGFWKTKIFLLIERCLAYYTDCIIVVSDSQFQELSDLYRVAPHHKFRTIPLGLDLDPFLTPFSDLKGVTRAIRKTELCVIGFVGRLVPVKNPCLLLKAVGEIEAWDSSSPTDSGERESQSPSSIAFVGGGELQHSLMQKVRDLNLRTQVRFEGWQSDVKRYYSLFDIVALTSINEGTPVTLIEAMAAGKPFVSTDVGGVKDLMVGSGVPMIGCNVGQFFVYDNGILVRSGDHKGFAAALIYLVQKPELRRKMGVIGRQFAVSRFGKDRLINDIKNLYLELAQQKVKNLSH